VNAHKENSVRLSMGASWGWEHLPLINFEKEIKTEKEGKCTKY
jgi:hypothetical protein